MWPFRSVFRHLGDSPPHLLPNNSARASVSMRGHPRSARVAVGRWKSRNCDGMAKLPPPSDSFIFCGHPRCVWSEGGYQLYGILIPLGIPPFAVCIQPAILRLVGIPQWPRKVGRKRKFGASASSRLHPSDSAAKSSRRFLVQIIGLLINPKVWIPTANCTIPSGRSILRIGYPAGNYRIPDGRSIL